MQRSPTITAAVVALTLPVHSLVWAQAAIDPIGTPRQMLQGDNRTPPRHTPPDQPPIPDHDLDDATLVIPGDDADVELLPDDSFFSIPHRRAYRNIFDRSIPLEEIEFIPGASNVVVDVTTLMGSDQPIAMMSYAIVNLNDAIVLFDSTFTFYPDLNGSPDMHHPIGSATTKNLWAPGPAALGVARIYPPENPPFSLPPGRIWFGVEVSNIRGPDTSLFGQIITNRIDVGHSDGIVLDFVTSPPTVLTGVVPNVDRLITPTLACVADWNMDSSVNVHDYAAFIDDYLHQPEMADYNNDRTTDVRDFGAFIFDYIDCID